MPAGGSRTKDKHVQFKHAWVEPQTGWQHHIAVPLISLRKATCAMKHTVCVMASQPAALLSCHATHAMAKVQVRRDVACLEYINMSPAQEPANHQQIIAVQLTLLGLMERPGLEVRCEPLPAKLLLPGGPWASSAGVHGSDGGLAR
jgi:hypothetical protein